MWTPASRTRNMNQVRYSSSFPIHSAWRVLLLLLSHSFSLAGTSPPFPFIQLGWYRYSSSSFPIHSAWRVLLLLLPHSFSLAGTPPPPFPFIQLGGYSSSSFPIHLAWRHFRDLSSCTIDDNFEMLSTTVGEESLCRCR
jgi:hypothetical protein